MRWLLRTDQRHRKQTQTRPSHWACRVVLSLANAACSNVFTTSISSRSTVGQALWILPVVCLLITMKCQRERYFSSKRIVSIKVTRPRMSATRFNGSLVVVACDKYQLKSVGNGPQGTFFSCPILFPLIHGHHQIQTRFHLELEQRQSPHDNLFISSLSSLLNEDEIYRWTSVANKNYHCVSIR